VTERQSDRLHPVLTAELLIALRRMGHDIVVLSTAAHYNENQEARSKQPLSRPRCWLSYESNYQPIPLYHASVPTKANRVAARPFDCTFFHAISTLA
jgi:hypothetical protein